MIHTDLYAVAAFWFSVFVCGVAFGTQFNLLINENLLFEYILLWGLSACISGFETPFMHKRWLAKSRVIRLHVDTKLSSFDVERVLSIFRGRKHYN